MWSNYCIGWTNEKLVYGYSNSKMAENTGDVKLEVLKMFAWDNEDF
jgi:hypothetical protein